MYATRQSSRKSAAAAVMPWLPKTSSTPLNVRRQRGLKAHRSGIAGEECAERAYLRRGARIISRRQRTPYGEIDLILQDDGVLVFVEVKTRTTLNGWDSPVSDNQWQRLKNSALHYMVSDRSQTDVQPICRFDVALVGRAGQVQIIENARSFDEH